MRVFLANNSDLHTAASLAARLWRHSADELASGFRDIVSRGGAIFLAEEDGVAAGFAQCQLRRDYVEGTSSSPIGYLEGIYVLEEYRHHGIAAALLNACESWARAQGCTEFASDCEISNTDSLAFHLRLGFHEANRIICFTKRLDGEKIE